MARRGDSAYRVGSHWSSIANFNKDLHNVSRHWTRCPTCDVEDAKPFQASLDARQRISVNGRMNVNSRAGAGDGQVDPFSCLGVFTERPVETSQINPNREPAAAACLCGLRAAILLRDAKGRVSLRRGDPVSVNM